MADSVRATVAILTYNGEQYLERILSALERQDFDGGFEVLVIDSGSTDRTLEIIAAHPMVRLHQIPNSEFGHGRTRNLAARLAHGEYIAYLTHDAIPLTPHWLREITAPFALDERIVGVMGKQVPRPHCFPLMKYEIAGVFAQFGPDFGTTVFYARDDDSDGTRGALAFYSDVNSAARRLFLTDTIPYQDVRYAEDQLFGRDVIDAGYQKAYAPLASVEHSNDVTLSEFGARIFDETIGLREIGHVIPPLSIARAIALAARGALRDSTRIVRDPHYRWRRRAYWLVVNPLYHLRKWSSYRRATRTDLTDSATIATNSLESRRKSLGGS